MNKAMSDCQRNIVNAKNVILTELISYQEVTSFPIGKHTVL